ncbi:MAG: FAD-binding protein, partial [Planctomycetota bacterium]|nr:FAD-binding protein [Planctomycetota bacterium]
HVIDVAVFSEMQQGHTVWMDFSRNPTGLDLARMDAGLWSAHPKIAALALSEPPLADAPLARLQAINRPSVEWLAERGIDLASGDRIELAPACQHFQGGVKINTHAATAVAGLFACGEAAGGQHGANRPGGNALMDSQVMGRIAGARAAALAHDSRPGEPVETRPEEPGAAEGEPLDVREVRRRIQHLMTMQAGIKRTEPGVAKGLAELADLRRRRWDAGSADDEFLAETRSIALVAEMVLTACGARPESRGPHLTFASPEAVTPLPRKDPDWQRYNVIRRGERGTMTVETRQPVPPDWKRAQPAGTRE